ncbi:hypothetical protein B9Z55_012599 [Caenorhabditis nigoni]|uniref:Abnormal cell migration protein 18-like fibronectin type I domain-containing protein n=1 Tax=Caenorhabditis nigoni TaxID=1611254 RepID=A0A2G5TYI8_9PELO|nr:hypothetical protein B9Z55_012599 [Caenorhabditis nigoni]
MLLFLFNLLCIPPSLALVDSVHNTKDTADSYPLLWKGDFHKNFVAFNVYNNYKTGEDTIEPSHSTRFGTGLSARLDDMHYGLYWGAVACAYNDLDEQLQFQKPGSVSDQSRLEVGESKMSGNGTVRVHCSQLDGHVKRVSEAMSGCYYNGTVYQIREEWEEPNPGNDSSLWKVMTCQRSENGYFESKIVGCLFDEIHNFTNPDDSVETWVQRNEYRLNEVKDFFLDNQYKKCVESEPGVVKLEKMAEDYEPVCTVNNVIFKDFYDDDVKGVRWECIRGRVEKNQCKVGKNRYLSFDSPEEQLPNGCKFICNLQTNIFKCDEALSMFKVEGKPRKMRKYEGWMPALQHYYG